MNLANIRCSSYCALLVSIALVVSLAGLVLSDLRTGRQLILLPSVQMAIGLTTVLLLLADLIGIRLNLFQT